MVEFADLKGRFRFAPGSLVRSDEDSELQPYIDRLEIHSDYLYIPQVARSDIDAFAARINSSSAQLFQTPFHGTLKVGNNWLFGGELKLRKPQDGRQTGIELKLKLYLNPTRFLQAHRANGNAELIGEQQKDPWSALRDRDGFSESLLPALQEARDYTFKLNDDNFLTHKPYSYGYIADWDERLRHYWTLVLNLIEGTLHRAARQMGRTAYALPQDLLQRLNWRVQQVEHYWEFAVSNSIEKVAAVSSPFSSVLRNEIVREFAMSASSETGVAHRATYVKGEFIHQDMIAKLYAKASGVVRFEFQYLRNPFSNAAASSRLIAPSLRSAGDINHVIRALMSLGRFSWERAEHFWAEFWRLHSSTGDFRCQDLIAFVSIVETMAKDSRMSAPELLSQLIQHSGGVNTRSVSEGGDVFHARNGRGRYRRRVVENVRGYAPNSKLYRLEPRFLPIVEGLRTLMDQASPDPDRDQERLPGRFRITKRVRRRRMAIVRRRRRAPSPHI